MPQTALADLYAPQAPSARRLAYLLTGDTQLAEDIVQDCFVKLARRLRHVEDPEPCLRRMAVNTSHSHHRRLRALPAPVPSPSASPTTTPSATPCPAAPLPSRPRRLSASCCGPTGSA